VYHELIYCSLLYFTGYFVIVLLLITNRKYVITIHLLQAHECRELELQAWNVITENFDAVSENPEFLEMAVDSLLEVIKYDDIQVIVIWYRL